MIQTIKSLWIKILSRIVAARRAPRKGFDSESMVHRRVAVTVERETVSILLPGASVVQGAAGTGSGKGGRAARRPELPPPAPSTHSHADESTPECPAETASRKSGEGKP
jgi:hypothetical protein